MGLFSVVLLAVALSLDTFAVALSISMCKGQISLFRKYRYISVIALFHVVMPMIGWIAGSSIHHAITDYDHWIVFVLLSYIGGKMIIGGRKQPGEDETCRTLSRYVSLGGTFLFGLILSIDAIIAGFSCALLRIDIFPQMTQWTNMLTASLVIGTIAFLLTAAGFRLGNFAGKKLGGKSEIFGGFVLIAIAIKTLIEHLLQ